MRELEWIIKDEEFIFESLHDGISIIDHRGIIVYANNSNTRITKKDKSYFLGKHVQDIVPDLGMPGVLEIGQKPVYEGSHEICTKILLERTNHFCQSADFTVFGSFSYSGRDRS